MQRFRSLRTLAIALCAVMAAGGGMALANGSLTAAKKKKHNDAKADKKLFKKLLAQAAPNLTVKAAGTATNATNAAHANNANNANNANTVGGLRVLKIFYASAVTGTPTTLHNSN